MARESRTPARESIGEKLTALLVDELQNFAGALGERMASTVTDRVGSVTDRLTDYATKSGDPRNVGLAAGATKLAQGSSPISAMLSAATTSGKERLKRPFGGAKRKGKKGKLKVTNIVEFIDVGVPVRVAYNQWTQFEDFPSFMKKVENVERESDEKLTWKAQVFWSHRTWESTIVEMVPDERIVWRSTGDKGSVDGGVSFHAITPNLTRIVLVLEYHPQGFFEKTGNIWRAQGRRARLELKHFVRHVMTQTALQPDEVEGWRGEIRDGEVVRDHESAVAEERERREREAGERERGEREAGEREAGDRRARERGEPEDREPYEEPDYDQEEGEAEQPPEEELEETPPRRRPRPRQRGEEAQPVLQRGEEAQPVRRAARRGEQTEPVRRPVRRGEEAAARPVRPRRTRQTPEE
jgi:uncharacterized membrane protein